MPRHRVREQPLDGTFEVIEFDADPQHGPKAVLDAGIFHTEASAQSWIVGFEAGWIARGGGS